MSIYINRDDALNELIAIEDIEAFNLIHNLPIADVVEVKHGRWIDKPTGRYHQWQTWCSVCGQHNKIGGIKSNRHSPFCPQCGAKMDLED